LQGVLDFMPISRLQIQFFRRRQKNLPAAFFFTQTADAAVARRNVYIFTAETGVFTAEKQ